MKKLSIILLPLLFSTAVFAQHDHHEAKTALKAENVNAEHSLYHIEAEWTDHRNDTFNLDQFKGVPVIVVMFYGNCTEVCPILIRDAWRLYSEVDDQLKSSVKVLAVTFDTDNDSPEVLRKYAEYEQLDLPAWHFVTAGASDIRSLAMMLGVQFSKKGDGHFTHTNLVTVLDEEGRIAERVEGLNQPMEKAADVIESIIKNIHLQ